MLHDGKIVDGKTRYKACVQLGIEPSTTKWDGKGSLTDFVCDMNMNRRDVSKNQRYAIALKLKQAYAKEAKENQRLSKGRGKKGSCSGHKPFDARKMACRKARVGEHSLAAIEELHEKARDLFDSVFRGDISLTVAEKTLKKREKPDYFEDVIGHLFIEWALPENTWVSDVRLGRKNGVVVMKVRHQNENGLKEAVMKDIENLPLKSCAFQPLDEIEQLVMGQKVKEEMLDQTKANIHRFQGRMKQKEVRKKKVGPKKRETKTVDDALPAVDIVQPEEAELGLP